MAAKRRHEGVSGANCGLREKGESIRLAVGSVVRMDGEGDKIHVLQGIIWLTRHPATGDEIYYPGDEFVLGANGPYVLEAIEEAEIAVKW